MGKGKSRSKSQSAYSNKKNSRILNKKFIKKAESEELSDNTESGSSDKNAAHTPSLFLEYFRNSTKMVSLTRNPKTVCGKDARVKFYEMVRNYEDQNGVSLCNLSKNEIMFRLLSDMEKKETLIYLKDNSRQFLPYKFTIPDIVKIYLYKLFYTQIFDFEIVNDGSTVDINFKSDYIHKNFDKIYQQIEHLLICIWYDGLLIAIEKLSSEIIASIKKSVEPDVDPTDSVDDLKTYLEAELASYTDQRLNLLENFIPATIFWAKYLTLVYKDRKVLNHKVTTILKSNAFYKGQRTFSSRNALKKTYATCDDLLSESSAPFTRILNLYYINKRSNLFDFDILTQNCDFASYELDGIVSKYQINEMIMINSTDFCSTEKNKSALSDVHNNPNCVIANISSRDYEIVNFLISAAANSARLYYLDKYGNDASAATISDLISCINLCDYSKEINNVVIPAEKIEIDDVDFEKIKLFNNPIPQD